MIHVPLFCFCLTAGLSVSSSLRTLDKRLDCNQLGLDNCKINNCSDKCPVTPRQHAPVNPEWGPEHVGVWMDEHGLVPVLSVTWKIKPDGSVKALCGSEINIRDESTYQCMCVQFSYKLNSNQQQNPKHEQWTFSLNGVIAEPEHTYMVSVINLPEPDVGDYVIRKQITIPGCGDRRIQNAVICLENGSVWDHHLTTDVSLKERKTFSIFVGFEAAEYSQRYRVSLQSHGFHSSKNVSKGNTALLNATFEFGSWQISQCKMLLTIQPFFIRCKNDCRRLEETIDLCPYYQPRTWAIKATVELLIIGVFLGYLLWRAFHKDPVNTGSSAAKQQPQGFQVQERRRVLIIYSLDHPLYKNIILKLCAFLSNKCGTEVVLDLLDSTRLGVLGSIQWLDWHREQMESSSDKILILCSRGVQAKWRAMCGDKQVFLREDARSPVGDMLSPALSLVVPHFIRSTSFEKYIVAYFDDVCSEEDVPSPFNIIVRYKLMKQFEELFFRILDTEKHEPGRVNHIKGFSEGEYCHCPSGRALREAIEAFQAYQLEHPQWFEDELLESSELKAEENSAEICDNTKTTTNLTAYRGPASTIVTSHVTTQENDYTADRTGQNVAKEFQMCTMAEVTPFNAENMQQV